MCSQAARRHLSACAAAVTLASLLTLGGCAAHFVSRGSALYDEGHYVEAAEVFEQTATRLDSCSSRERARFGLYRGANFLKLGDAEHAARWLGYARAIQSSEPSALDPGEAALLSSSLQALGRRTVEPARHERSEIATAPAAARTAPAE